MADVQVVSTSRLLFNSLLIVDGFTFWDLLDLPAFVSRPGDMKCTPTSNDRIDLIANSYYRDPNLWWVIAWANNMEILPTDLKVNVQIVIPDPNYILNNFLPTATK